MEETVRNRPAPTEAPDRMSRIQISAPGKMTSKSAEVVIVKDLSEAGVFISCRRPLKDGTELTVAFDIPLADGIERVCVRGVVRHSRRRDKERGMGIRFLRLTYTHAELIREFLRSRGVDTEAMKAELNL